MVDGGKKHRGCSRLWLTSNFTERDGLRRFTTTAANHFHSTIPGPRCNKKKREPTSPPPLNAIAAISYLWPECVIRAMMSRRLSSTVEPANSARSAGVHLAIVALIAAAHLSMPSALG